MRTTTKTMSERDILFIQLVFPPLTTKVVFSYFFKPTQNVIPKHFDQPNMKKFDFFFPSTRLNKVPFKNRLI